ncbi:MAG: ABC transporter ATP-binding protein [Anaerococcus sp.]|nr:ABC transporter ATP-binding protein [Anaerococcus sp.]
MIEFKNVSKIFDKKAAVNDVSFRINDGEFFVIVGSSGSGKTTCLKMINRIIEPSSGKVLIDGKDVMDFDKRNLRLDIGYVLQQGTLFPNMTVFENVELIGELKGMDKGVRKDRVNSYLDKVGLDPKVFAKRYPEELSGGQAQRIGIIRAIVANPKLLLMDEPFSALDPITRDQLQDLVKKIHEDLKISTVFVTHDMNEALKLGDRICLMRNGEVVQIDTPEGIKNNPENDFVKKFFKEGALYE